MVGTRRTPPAATCSSTRTTPPPCRRHSIPSWESGPEVPYTILLDADGNVLYQTDAPVDTLKLRRTILANLPSAYIGLNNYWLQK